MKIKTFIVCLLAIVVCAMGYFLFDLKNKNTDLKKKYNEMEDIIKKNESDAVFCKGFFYFMRVKENKINREEKIYFEKKKELEELKEKNKDKIVKYEEVEKWNQEIEDYLN